MKTGKALIFDFNGTLFWDTSYNREAWGAIAKKYRNKPFTDEEMHLLNGRTNYQTVAYLLGYSCDQKTADSIAREKEALYIQICEDHHPLHLAPGAESLLKKAKLLGIPMAIATSAGKENMDHYKQWFSLGRYFDEHLIITDDGKRRGKPEPDIYLEACKALGYSPSSCIVFEDTKSGIQSAINAGITEIYAIASNGADIETIKAMEHVHGLLSDFNQFNL
ncbi:haloacid dehalogenase superfamily protein, subfamily IA, variant 3 with third motif having DD or ED [Sphaerochaeta pleomorpha str. Grapes]|uniref:Haloacid dehalogenase superfamily protein, subfamily IA, variant 3 with third motif having DD or ED n=1 Tax=Sphaerochaeta pleomorpha (strain ATCC BAA-1885 / DSM 22778 / Grapes) TaxID=158190 RepID=G8QY12_SPHPG|nr:HAD family phosphatase [Sphaerochaeta pleomorpha]AEV28517.1 haloacid dehalogenase superfamily protein, subfamily IA, variant 3 with third motif having DD or ED [Sphaerochaeta pleomorpha str. Grapes]